MVTQTGGDIEVLPFATHVGPLESGGWLGPDYYGASPSEVGANWGEYVRAGKEQRGQHIAWMRGGATTGEHNL